MTTTETDLPDGQAAAEATPGFSLLPGPFDLRTMQQLPCAMTICDLRLRGYPVVFANEHFAQLTGYQANDVYGFGLGFLAGAETDPLLLHNMSEAMRVGSPLEITIRHYRRNGLPFWNRMQLFPMPGSEGQLQHYLILHTDVSSKHQELAQLELGSRCFAQAEEGLMVTDRNGVIVDVNRMFSTITGYSRAEVIGKKPGILKSGLHEDTTYRELWDSLARQGAWSGYLRNRRKNGDIYTQHVNISAIRDANSQVTHYVANFADLSAQRKTRAELQQILYYDALTGLPTRALFCDRVREAITHQSRHHGGGLALCYLDIDNFMAVNQSLGNEGGNQLLIDIARRLRSVVTDSDMLGHLGGDEFVVALRTSRQGSELTARLDALMHAITHPYLIEQTSLTITASIGVTRHPEDSGDTDQLLRHAGEAMLASKRNGKGRVEYYAAPADPEPLRAGRPHLHVVAHERHPHEADRQAAETAPHDLPFERETG